MKREETEHLCLELFYDYKFFARLARDAQADLSVAFSTMPSVRKHDY